MASDPKYVRLANRLSRGMVADLDSGWKISGLDVRQFPEDPQAAKYVRAALNAGKLEAASKSEWEEVHEQEEEDEEEKQARLLGDAIARGLSGGSGHQEAQSLLKQREKQQKVAEARAKATKGDEDEEDDPRVGKAREERVKTQKKSSKKSRSKKSDDDSGDGSGDSNQGGGDS